MMENIIVTKITYKEAYDNLEKLAGEVQDLDLSDLDELIGITQKAAKYVKVCEDRIKIIKEKLDKLNDD
jgi:exonuclease VII small subunit